MIYRRKVCVGFLLWGSDSEGRLGEKAQGCCGDSGVGAVPAGGPSDHDETMCALPGPGPNPRQGASSGGRPARVPCSLRSCAVLRRWAPASDASRRTTILDDRAFPRPSRTSRRDAPGPSGRLRVRTSTHHDAAGSHRTAAAEDTAGAGRAVQPLGAVIGPCWANRVRLRCVASRHARLHRAHHLPGRHRADRRRGRGSARSA